MLCLQDLLAVCCFAFDICVSLADHSGSLPQDYDDKCSMQRLRCRNDHDVPCAGHFSDRSLGPPKRPTVRTSPPSACQPVVSLCLLHDDERQIGIHSLDRWCVMYMTNRRTECRLEMDMMYTERGSCFCLWAANSHPFASVYTCRPGIPRSGVWCHEGYLSRCPST